MIARAVQIIHQGLDLQERTARLLLRLDLGIQGPAVGLARYAGRLLTGRITGDCARHE